MIAAIRTQQPIGQFFEPAELLAAPDTDSNDEPWRALEVQERLRACWERLCTTGDLSDRDRDAFESVALRDEAAESVASRLHLSVSRVYGIKHEVTKKLRAIDRGLTRILGEV